MKRRSRVDQAYISIVFKKESIEKQDMITKKTHENQEKFNIE